MRANKFGEFSGDHDDEDPAAYVINEVRQFLDMAEVAATTGDWSKARQALARELGGEEHIPLAIEIYRFEQKQAAERDSAAARVRFDLDEPYDAGWRWREFS